MYDIRIVTILTANDNGSQAATPAPADIKKSIDIANQVFNPHGINFLFDPATDIYRFNDDLLNRDCARRDHQLYTDENVGPANNPLLDADTYNKHRNEVALRFPGRIAVYFTAGSRYWWNGSERRWIYGPRTFSWSNHTDEFVTMASWAVGNDGMAHEIGHYLHLDHTHAGGEIKHLNEAVARILKFVDVDHGSKDAVLGLFDGDGVADTPPDPGPALFKNQCDPAESSATIKVNFADGSVGTYSFSPDRENIMNYWDKTCRGGIQRISSAQAQRAFEALHDGNRRHLVEPAVLYFGAWGNGDRSQTRAISWAMQDFANRFNEELKVGRRCVHMQAYDIGGGQIRFDGVWEMGNGAQQTRAITWAMGDFANRFNEELKVGRRCVHMQAYDIGGGQIRYDGVWEKADGAQQTRAIAWAMGDFVNRFDAELKVGRRCAYAGLRHRWWADPLRRSLGERRRPGTVVCGRMGVQ